MTPIPEGDVATLKQVIEGEDKAMISGPDPAQDQAIVPPPRSSSGMPGSSSAYFALTCLHDHTDGAPSRRWEHSGMSSAAITANLRSTTSATTRRHLAWLAGALAGSFAVPFAFADQLGMPRDPYYAIYVAFVAAVFVGWVRDTGQSLSEMLARRWRLTCALAVVFAAAAVALVLAAEDGTARPDGLEFLGGLLWRGVIYGLADGLLLTAFPILVVFAAVAAHQPARHGRMAWARTAALALAASLVFTAVYHLGYADFRSDKVRKPMAGDLIWAPSTLITLNPIGAPIVHASMHTAAVIHSYDTDLFLPPH